jgi:hypothetical protein
MPQVGFEPKIPVYEWAKTVHASDRAATVIAFNFLSASLVFQSIVQQPVDCMSLPIRELFFTYSI